MKNILETLKKTLWDNKVVRHSVIAIIFALMATAGYKTSPEVQTVVDNVVDSIAADTSSSSTPTNQQ